MVADDDRPLVPWTFPGKTLGAFGSLWGALGLPSAYFWVPRAPFGLPWGCLGAPLASLGPPLGDMVRYDEIWSIYWSHSHTKSIFEKNLEGRIGRIAIEARFP